MLVNSEMFYQSWQSGYMDYKVGTSVKGIVLFFEPKLPASYLLYCYPPSVPCLVKQITGKAQ